MSARSSKPRPPLPGGPYLVVGLARSGSAVAAALAARGEAVIGSDSGRPAEAEGLRQAGVEVHLDGDGTNLLERAATVVKSPGVPGEAAAITAAHESRLPVLGELEVAWRLLPNRFTAVTGTNGKTTVTELLGHLHRTAAMPVEVAGNVGTPLASLVDGADPDATIVCECSSFQLEDSEAFAPECAVFLNFAPDHLDRHPTLDDYLAAKLRIFANQGPEDTAVFDAGEPALRGTGATGKGRRVPYCATGDIEAGVTECAVALADGELVADGEPLLGRDELPLPGRHNLANAMAAAAAALSTGVSRDAVTEGLRTFPGIRHRMEHLGERGGVLFVNDSKATNAAAAAAALASFESGVHAILGGSAKGSGFEGLVEAVVDRCRACYLIGEAADRLEADLTPALDAGVAIVRSERLEDAVRSAAAAAAAGEVVLLAPACASFDAYRDYEERGDHFRSLVEEMR